MTATQGSGARPAQTSADKARQKISPSPGALVLACRRRRPGGLEERRRRPSLAGRLPFGLPPAALALLAGSAAKRLVAPARNEHIVATDADLAPACSSPGSPGALILRAHPDTALRNGATGLLSRIGNARKAGRFGFSRFWAETVVALATFGKD